MKTRRGSLKKMEYEISERAKLQKYTPKTAHKSHKEYHKSLRKKD